MIGDLLSETMEARRKISILKVVWKNKTKPSDLEFCIQQKYPSKMKVK